jgi:RHS repeat-associated protein
MPSESYRYGFNGKENDNDVKGTGNQQDYGMRIYDPRLGRFLSVDPITKNYPELTPYQFASNRPIDGIDLDGLEYIQGKISVYGLNKFEPISDKYTVGHLWVKNQEIHKIVMHHERINKIVNDGGLADPGEAPDLSVDRLRTKTSWNKKQEAHRQNKAFNQNVKNASGDFASGAVDAMKFGIGLYGNLTDKEELSEAYEGLKALHNADKLVRSALGAPSFPSSEITNSTSFYTDLVNYITDGTRPDVNLNNPKNGILIETWGNLLFNNRDKINTMSYNFNPQQVSLGSKELLTGSGTIFRITFKQVLGNPDELLQRAIELLKNSGDSNNEIFKKAKL